MNFTINTDVIINQIMTIFQLIKPFDSDTVYLHAGSSNYVEARSEGIFFPIIAVREFVISS